MDDPKLAGPWSLLGHSLYPLNMHCIIWLLCHVILGSLNWTEFWFTNYARVIITLKKDMKNKYINNAIEPVTKHINYTYTAFIASWFVFVDFTFNELSRSAVVFCDAALDCSTSQLHQSSTKTINNWI